jgi:crotonobetainyl-CoA:carnitine CoA-transferase CaiB-like acyl-CoA transferase
LWAGPLTAHLLALAGADVVQVESVSRPDPTRTTAPEFHALLHRDIPTCTVDFAEAGALCRLLADADVVIEASRPRALEALGASADVVLADGRARVWVRITGHRDPQRVAFGDDAAVAGGLVAWEGAHPVFAADALADPLTGLVAAVVTAALLEARSPGVVDIHLAEVAAHCICPPSEAPAGLAVAPPRVATRAPAVRRSTV